MSLADIYRDAGEGATAPEDVLEALCAAAEVFLAPIPLDRERFVRALAALGSDAARLDPERGAELALAIACAERDPRALKLFEERFVAMLPHAIGHMKLSPDVVDDVVQEVRRKLLVGDPPKLLGYAGKGSLRGLLKVTATRTAISIVRKGARVGPGDDPVLDPEASRDFEASFLKERYRGAFRDAFEGAIRTLDRHERNLLRLHFIGRVTLEQLATMYGVHRATIVRRLARVRGAIEKHTHAELRKALGVDKRELESIMGLVRSRMDLSVERMLRTMESDHA